MKNKPKNLEELILRYEQMKVNLDRNRHNREVTAYVGQTYVEYAPLFKQYGDSKRGTEYMLWYENFINKRV